MPRILIALPLLLVACPSGPFMDQRSPVPLRPASYALGRPGPLLLAARADVYAFRSNVYVELELAAREGEFEVRRLEIESGPSFGNDPRRVGTSPSTFYRSLQTGDDRPNEMPIRVRAFINDTPFETRLVLILESR